MVEDQDNSILASRCKCTRLDLCIPQGFGNWRATVASISGLIAKENVVGTLRRSVSLSAGELSENGDEIWGEVANELHRNLCLQLHDLQPAVRTVLRSYGRYQA